MSKILITGATGQLGKAVVNELLQKVNARDISIMVRDARKAEELKLKGVNVIKGDYTDFDSLVAAFKEIEKLYFISSSDKTNRFAQHQNVVKAAVEAKVGHIFYTSAHRKSEDETSPLAGDAHWQTDALIKQSGLTYTILKHSLYTELLPLFIGDKVFDSGIIFLPAGGGRSSYATRADLAAAGAVVLTTEGHQNSVYELGSQHSYSFQDIAEMLSGLSGKNIQFVSPSIDVYSEQLKSHGVPEKMIQGALTFCIALMRGEFDFPSSDLETLLGRKPQSVKDYLKTAYNL